jgi:hypothetical protein
MLSSSEPVLRHRAAGVGKSTERSRFPALENEEREYFDRHWQIPPVLPFAKEGTF